MTSQPFSRVYCRLDELVKDSVRLRNRLGTYCTKNFFDKRNLLIEVIEVETGARIPFSGGVKSLDKFFREAELRDVLDAVTHIYEVLQANKLYSSAKNWLYYVARAFSEEHVAYAVSANGSVGYVVDEAYAANRKATLSRLQNIRWSAARAEFERAFEAMDRDPVDTNGAIRAISASVESCAKVILGNAVSRVGPAEIEKELWPLLKKKYAADAVAADASHLMLKSYADWVNSTHQYRHGQGEDSEVHAPLTLSVITITFGCGVLRWLIDLDL